MKTETKWQIKAGTKCPGSYSNYLYHSNQSICLKVYTDTCIPSGTIDGCIHEGSVIGVLLVLNVAEDVLAASVDRNGTELLGYTEIPCGESVGMLYLGCFSGILGIVINIHSSL